MYTLPGYFALELYQHGFDNLAKLESFYTS